MPRFIEQTNCRRGTPHWAILIAMGIPLLILVAVRGNVGFLGDLYAFGLLGAFSMTCVSLDIVRWHERHSEAPHSGNQHSDRGFPIPSRLTFVVGALTTALVTLAWITNLFAKPLATFFGGAVTLVGLVIAFVTYKLAQRGGLPAVFPLVHQAGQPVFFLSRARRMRPVAVMAILPHEGKQTRMLVEEAGRIADGRSILFLHHGSSNTHTRVPRLFEVVSPYLEDRLSQQAFGETERIAQHGHLDRRYMYLPATAEKSAVVDLWKALQPREVIVISDDESALSALPVDQVQRVPALAGRLVRYVTRKSVQ